MQVIILLGAPGAGKGTTAEGVRAATDFVHVSTGDMLRMAVAQKTAMGQEADGYMKRGALVPDAVIIRLVEDRLDHGDLQAAYMFDGFPRTLDQARLLDGSLARRGVAIRKVFYLDADREILIARLAGRRMCSNAQCNANYHVTNIPPRQAGVCDKCGSKLYQRPDDEEATIKKRLDVFSQQTEALIVYYERKGVLMRLDSSRHRDATVREIVQVLRSSAGT